jgi:tetratricopeptide (TPR) repeat protein
MKKISLLASVSILSALLVFLFPISAQDQIGPVVKKLSRSNNFDIPPDTDADAAKLIKEGDDLLEQRKERPKEWKELTEGALKVLKKALPKAPKVAALRFFLCLAYQGVEKDDSALKEIEEGLKLNPDFYELQVEKADIMVRKEKYDEALKLCDQAIEKGPNYTYAYEAKANLMMKQKKFKDALELCKKVRSMEHEEYVENGLKELLPVLENEVKGPDWAQTFKAEGDNYIITTDDSQGYADRILKCAEAVYKAYTKVFPKRSSGKKEDKFPIMIFSRAEGYHRYGGPVGSGGFFNPQLGKVVFIKIDKPDQESNFLFHELFHQFLSKYVDDPPYWFNEGHADFFGGFHYNEKENQLECQPNPMRFQPIQQIVRQNAQAPLSTFLQMDRQEYYDRRRIDINYAQGWSFVYFLWRFQDGKYCNYVKEYFNLIKSKKKYSLKELYQKVFARDIATLEAEWRAFVLRGCR